MWRVEEPIWFASAGVCFGVLGEIGPQGEDTPATVGNFDRELVVIEAAILHGCSAGNGLNSTMPSFSIRDRNSALASPRCGRPTEMPCTS